MYPFEKEERRPRPAQFMQAFWDVVDDCQLSGLGFVGDKFTWHTGDIRERLDRALSFWRLELQAFWRQVGNTPILQVGSPTTAVELRRSTGPGCLEPICAQVWSLLVKRIGLLCDCWRGLGCFRYSVLEFKLGCALGYGSLPIAKMGSQHFEEKKPAEEGTKGFGRTGDLMPDNIKY